jgi:hypothetical protein
MELSPFLSVSVREKNHFMKCRGRRMANFWRWWEEKYYWLKRYIFYIQIRFKEHSRVQVSIHLLRRNSTCFYDWAETPASALDLLL